MKKLTTAILFAIVSLCASFAYAQHSPIPMLQSSADEMLSTLKQHKGKLKENKEVIYQAVKSALLPHVDVVGMSRSVLGREVWLKASKAERRAFAEEFTNLVIRTYASPLAEYSDENIKFLPIRGSIEGRFVQVNSLIIRNDGPNIPVNYSLVLKGEEWKVYDLSVEGVSLLQSFRSQFAQALQNASISKLIADMKKQGTKAG